jgi:hypothetical protein
MRDLKKMQERFNRDGNSVRLGNLASDLLRLSKWIQARHNDEAIIDLMREIAWLMEWSGDSALAELADMQREICRWASRLAHRTGASYPGTSCVSDVEPDPGMLRSS